MIWEEKNRKGLEMEVAQTRKLELFSGNTHRELAEKIASCLGLSLGEANLQAFANGELHCKYSSSIRGADVFIIQTHANPINTSIMEQLIMIDAAKRASAKRITAVCPYFGYSRQDRKASGREPITAKLVADLLTAAGADRVVSVDLHSGQIQGFFNYPVDHLTATPVLIEYLKKAGASGDVIVSPDAGRLKVAERFSQQLGADVAVIHKRRPRGQMNTVEALGVIGDVAGRRCIIIDDMIDTAGTVSAAAERLTKEGAIDVWVMATHGLLSDPAAERLAKAPVSKVVVTDTLPMQAHNLPNLEVLSVAQLLADAISAVFEDTSVSKIFGGDNLS